jgi:septal ring factor EnvC (AmiA/AmiB activator)
MAYPEHRNVKKRSIRGIDEEDLRQSQSSRGQPQSNGEAELSRHPPLAELQQVRQELEQLRILSCSLQTMHQDLQQQHRILREENNKLQKDMEGIAAEAQATSNQHQQSEKKLAEAMSALALQQAENRQLLQSLEEERLFTKQVAEELASTAECRLQVLPTRHAR